MEPTFELRDIGFDIAFREMEREARFSAPELVTRTAQSILKLLARFTPRASQKGFFDEPPAMRGRARAGWWQAWRGLKMPGEPFIKNPNIPFSMEGDFVDNRHAAGETSVTMINNVWYIETLEGRVKILGKAYATQTRRIEDSLQRTYQRMFRRRSA